MLLLFIWNAIIIAMKSQYLAKHLLPDAPGVYIFRDRRKRPIYIGRATSLKDRVRSYFANDLIETRGPRIVDMITKAKSLSFQETDTVLEAILLESELIKRYQPYYNVDERDDKSSQYIVITDEEWPRVFLERARNLNRAGNQDVGHPDYKIKQKFGPFPDSGLIKEALKILRRLFPFKDKKAHDARHDLFYQAIGRSPNGAFNSSGGDSTAGDDAKAEYQKTIERLILFFQGKKKDMLKKLEKEMNRQASRMEFEAAGETKKLLYGLRHINDIALIKEDGHSKASAGKTRIEAYDIAHLAGTDVVGGMVVSIGGELAKSEYRKFRLNNQTNNDPVNLAEILARRMNHSEWTFPDLIVVDGNEIQMKAAESALKARRVSIPVMAVTKDGRHKATRLIGDSELIRKYKKEIITLNSEAHRFVISYHRQKRKLF